MSIMAIVLSLVGVLAIVIEFYVPGGIMALVGTLLLVLGTYIFSLNTKPIYVLLFFIGQICFLSVCLVFTLRKVYKTRSEGGMTLHKDQSGFVGAKTDKRLIGKTGIAVYDMKPSGHVLIDGKEYHANSNTGYVLKGTKIKVISSEQGYYIITKITKDKK